jgi:hypothetical protein
MGARQKHGFRFEVLVAELTGFTADRAPGAEFDLTWCDEDTGERVPVSLKAKATNGELCLGDLRRAQRAPDDFLLIVGEYAPRDKTKTIIRVTALRVRGERWRAEFAYEHTAEMLAEIKLIEWTRRDRARWAAFCARHSAAFKHSRPDTYSGGALRIKGDANETRAGERRAPGKLQRRVQCAFPCRAWGRIRRAALRDDPDGLELATARPFPELARLVGRPLTAPPPARAAKEDDDDDDDRAVAASPPPV